MVDRTDADDLCYEQLLTVLRPQIVEEMIASHVLHYIPSLAGTAGDIFKVERRSRTEAAHLLLDKILERRGQRGWFAEFLNALRLAEFEKLVKRLSFEDVKDDHVFRELMSVALPVLVNVNPMPVMIHLLQSKVISKEDFEEVQQLEREGRHVAMVELLHRLPLRTDGWFEKFALALKKNNEREALKALEPMLELAGSDESICRIVRSLECDNAKDFESDPEKLKKLNASEDDSSLPEAIPTGSVEMEGGEMSTVLEYQENRQPSLTVSAPNIDFNMSDSVQDKKSYSKDEKLSVPSTPVNKPVAAAARFPHSDSSSLSSNSQDSSPMMSASPGSSRGETRAKESFSSHPPVSHEMQETAPKSVDIQDNLRRRTQIYPPDDGAYSFRSEVFGNIASAQAGRDRPTDRERSNADCDRSEIFSSCSDNNCQSHLNLRPTESEEDSNASSRETKTLITDSLDSSVLGLDEDSVLIPNEVLVSNLPQWTTTEALVEHFGLIGDIQLNSKGQPKVRFFRDQDTGHLKGKAVITYANETYANGAVEIFNDTEWEGNILKIEIAWRRNRSPLRSESRSSSFIEQTDTLTEERIEDSTLGPSTFDGLKLRSYQEELAAKAKRGLNCIVVAPTGSGKTHVAMEIIRHHIERQKARNASPKIVFFVPTVALVEQQRKQFERYLKDCKILGLSGDQDGKLPLSELIPIDDIIVLTPQILENALKEKDITTLSLFSLMIFDECHHTSKNHPYNMIMSHYIDEKLDRARPMGKFPQVVGLTASVGVGKSKSMDQAVVSVLKLCANMDAEEICTVREHLEELIEHVNRPEESTTMLSSRKEDPFFDTINEIMEKIEDKMKKSEFTTSAQEENSEFGRILQVPAERGGDRYTQWMSRLQKTVDAIYLQATRRFYVACLKSLQIYNTALLINADCRTKDALDYIVKELNPAMGEDLGAYHDETDRWLKKLFEDREIFLDAVSKDPKYENPKLNFLKQIICDRFRIAPDSRGIIFCKTREMTVALVNWMNDSQELKKFNPHNLVGSNAPSNRAGMTQVKQENVLKYFKRGNHQVIVATSVAEEGLDVEKCNFVIRYEHVTNQIARVQSRGRARTKDAHYLTVGEKGRGSAEKEEWNKIRESMMQKAIDIIDRYSSAEKRKRINQYQREAQVEREMAEKGKLYSKVLKASQNTNSQYTFRCLKCDNFTAYSSDIRKIEDSHHVILDKNYQARIIIRPHPGPKKFENFELTGKIYCKRCHADWGMMGVYKKVSFPVVKVSSLIVVGEDGQRKVYKRWKQVPFNVQPLTPDDLQEMMDQLQSEADETGSFDDGDDGNGDDDDDDEFRSMYSL